MLTLLLLSLIATGIGLEVYWNRDWAGVPDGDVTPILIKRDFFGYPLVFNKVRLYSQAIRRETDPAGKLFYSWRIGKQDGVCPNRGKFISPGHGPRSRTPHPITTKSPSTKTNQNRRANGADLVMMKTLPQISRKDHVRGKFMSRQNGCVRIRTEPAKKICTFLRLGLKSLP